MKVWQKEESARLHPIFIISVWQKEESARLHPIFLFIQVPILSLSLRIDGIFGNIVVNDIGDR